MKWAVIWLTHCKELHSGVIKFWNASSIFSRPLFEHFFLAVWSCKPRTLSLTLTFRYLCCCSTLCRLCGWLLIDSVTLNRSHCFQVPIRGHTGINFSATRYENHSLRSAKAVAHFFRRLVRSGCASHIAVCHMCWCAIKKLLTHRVISLIVTCMPHQERPYQHCLSHLQREITQLL